ncbi:hypothetical protein Cgig2_026814 [Carnegiea gigantea]|uniref:Uncharacterized protein n=1 Tax=Carnegiea gigantea TaxID=171969 RepID=A0A9Q1Q9P0_9CARY|nr:hypothetical protein Cgig2_026814 [Carnegiea gigantea]
MLFLSRTKPVLVSFMLKNASATYNMLVNKLFKEQINKSIKEVCLWSKNWDVLRLHDILEGHMSKFKEAQGHIRAANPQNSQECTKAHWLHGNMSKASNGQKRLSKLLGNSRITYQELTSLIPREALIIYLLVTNTTVSVVLLTEEEKRQLIVYFVSNVLAGPELIYPNI